MTRVLARLCWLTLVLLSGCSPGCGDHVAELQYSMGHVERDHAEQRGQFSGAGQGERFWLGDGLRTGNDGRAHLMLTPDGLALVEPNTLLRFLSGAPGKRHEHIALEEGTVTIERAPLDLEVHTPLAIARLSGQGKVQISIADSGVERFDVLVGRVSIDHEGTTQKLSAGQHLELAAQPSGARPAPSVAAPALAQVEDPNAPDAAAAPAPQGKSENENENEHQNENENENDEPVAGSSRRPDFTLPDEDAIIHVPAPPAHVRVPLPPCSAPARVELSGTGRSTQVTARLGAEHMVLPLNVGSQRIRVRCEGVLSRQVKLRVQRDAATQELPKTAPRVEVEADGRSYTVHYQNVLPAVTFGWSQAQPASSYTLVLKRGDRVQRYDSPRAQHALRAGELSEGEYQFSFEAPSGARSRDGVLRIVFDNLARSAYLSEPRPDAARSGDTVMVAGGALARSEVSVAGQPLPLDAQGRFRGEVPLAPGEDSLTVRVKHPLAGVHYYLRRVR